MTTPLPDAALLDTSVLVRLLVEHDDELQLAIPVIEDAWRDDSVELVLLDLSLYELVNVAVRRLHFDGERAARAVGDVYGLGAPVIALDQRLAIAAAEIAATTGLSGYDAAFLAAARLSGVALVTADRALAGQDGAISLAELA